MTLRLVLLPARDNPNDTGPTLPMNIERISAILEMGVETAVTPLETPTVAKPDTASKVASSPVRAFCPRDW